MISLKNEYLEIKILKQGVTFVSFKSVQDDINIITSFNDVNDYQNNDVYLGSLIGPLAGRTEPGSYNLDLDINNPPNHLHGGKDGLHTQIFDVSSKDNKAIFTKEHLGVFYTITVTLDKNTVILDMKASPEEKRPINLTNHMYFNLLGTSDLKDHEIKLQAEKVSYISEDMRNTNDLRDVKGSVFDLNEKISVQSLLNQTHSQFNITRHIDHSFLSNEVDVYVKNKHLNIKGTMPYMHLYFANYFDENFVDGFGRDAKNHASIAIEPQYLPNDKNMPHYDKDYPYHETIIYTLKIDS